MLYLRYRYLQVGTLTSAPVRASSTDWGLTWREMQQWFRIRIEANAAGWTLQRGDKQIYAGFFHITEDNRRM